MIDFWFHISIILVCGWRWSVFSWDVSNLFPVTRDVREVSCWEMRLLRRTLASFSLSLGSSLAGWMMPFLVFSPFFFSAQMVSTGQDAEHDDGCRFQVEPPRQVFQGKLHVNNRGKRTRMCLDARHDGGLRGVSVSTVFFFLSLES